MRNRVDKAIATIRGYCDKVVLCDKCRYSMDGGCPFTDSCIPSDWKMDIRQEEKTSK